MSEKCPNCGGEVRYYHSSSKYGDGVTRIVCVEKCNGWKVIDKWERTHKKEVVQWTK